MKIKISVPVSTLTSGTDFDGFYNTVLLHAGIWCSNTLCGYVTSRQRVSVFEACLDVQRIGNYRLNQVKDLIDEVLNLQSKIKLYFLLFIYLFNI